MIDPIAILGLILIGGVLFRVCVAAIRAIRESKPASSFPRPAVKPPPIPKTMAPPEGRLLLRQTPESVIWVEPPINPASRHWIRQGNAFIELPPRPTKKE